MFVQGLLFVYYIYYSMDWQMLPMPDLYDLQCHNLYEENEKLDKKMLLTLLSLHTENLYKYCKT